MKCCVMDCMSAKIRSVPPDMSASEALKILIRTGSSGLPVIDTAGAVLGVFTEKEILKTILPVYVKSVGTFVYGESSKSSLRKLAGLDKFTVKDIMRKEVPTINEDTSVAEASRIMLTQNERRVVVVRDGKAVGIVTRCDVVRCLAKEAGIEV